MSLLELTKNGIDIGWCGFALPKYRYPSKGKVIVDDLAELLDEHLRLIGNNQRRYEIVLMKPPKCKSPKSVRNPSDSAHGHRSPDSYSRDLDRREELSGGNNIIHLRPSVPGLNGHNYRILVAAYPSSWEDSDNRSPLESLTYCAELVVPEPEDYNNWPEYGMKIRRVLLDGAAAFSKNRSLADVMSGAGLNVLRSTKRNAI